MKMFKQLFLAGVGIYLFLGFVILLFTFNLYSFITGKIITKKVENKSDVEYVLDTATLNQQKKETIRHTDTVYLKENKPKKVEPIIKSQPRDTVKDTLTFTKTVDSTKTP